MTDLARDTLAGDAVAGALDGLLARALDRRLLLDAARADAPVPHLHRQLVDLGLPAIALGHDLGGLDLPLGAIAEVGAVMGRRLVPVAARDEALLLAPLLARAARNGDAAAERWLEGLLGGDVRGGARVAVDDPRLGTEHREDHVVVHLDALPVCLGPGAAVAAVATGTWTALLDLDDPSIARSPATALDAGQGATLLTGAQAVPLARVTDAATAERRVSVWLVGVSAEVTGVAQEMLDVSVEYARGRIQFGHPIASYQAVSHRLADMHVAVESSRALLARWVMLTEDGRDTRGLAAAARHGILQAARSVCESAIQVHGGLGFTWEQGLHLWYRRVLQIQAAFGGPTATASATGRAYRDALAARSARVDGGPTDRYVRQRES